jgi:hypothetical protein
MTIFYSNHRKVRIVVTDITPQMMSNIMNEQFVSNVDTVLREYMEFRKVIDEVNTFRENEHFEELREIFRSRYVNTENVAKFAVKHKLHELAKCYKSDKYITLRELFSLSRKEYTDMIGFSSVATYPRAHSLGREIYMTKKNSLKRRDALQDIENEIAITTNSNDLSSLRIRHRELELNKAEEIFLAYENFTKSRSQTETQKFFNFAIDNNLRETAIYMYLCMGCAVCTQFEEIVRKIEENTPVRGMGELETKSGVSNCLNLHYGASGTGKKASLQKIFEGLRSYSAYDKYYDGVKIGSKKYGFQFKTKYYNEIWGKRLPVDSHECIEESYADIHREYNIEDFETEFEELTT